MTNLDLHLSAQKCVLATIQEKSAHAVNVAKLAAFEADGMNPLDWEWWDASFTSQRAHLNSISVQKSVSQITADNAAKAAAKAAETK